MKIADYMNELEQYDFAIEFGDYNSGYICDIISEIADAGISIYTQEQIDYAMEHDDAVQEAFFSGIAPDPNDYFKNEANLRGYIAAVGAAAWYEDNIRTMYNNIDECVLYSVLTTLKQEYGVTELTDEQISSLESLEFDNDDSLEDIIDKAADFLGLNDEDEDE